MPALPSWLIEPLWDQFAALLPERDLFVAAHPWGCHRRRIALLVEGNGIPLGRVLAGAHRHDSPLLAPTLDLLEDLGPLPDEITVHLDAGYDSGKTRQTLTDRGLSGEIAHKGEKAPIQASQRWHVERANAWHNAFNRLQRCYERREQVIDAFFDLADAIITVRSLIRQAWTLYRWDTRPTRRP